MEFAEYNPGLGAVTKNSKHRADIARQKGLIEVGNDFDSGEKMQKYYEKKKKDEIESNWKDPGDFFLE